MYWTIRLLEDGASTLKTFTITRSSVRENNRVQYPTLTTAHYKTG
jgi:hypothetical protein